MMIFAIVTFAGFGALALGWSAASGSIRARAEVRERERVRRATRLARDRQWLEAPPEWRDYEVRLRPHRGLAGRI